MILESEVNVAFAPPSQLLFLKSRTLMTQTLDVDEGILVGEPRPIASDVGYVNRLALGDFSYSSAGILTTGGGRAVNREYGWFDRTGKQLGSACPPGNYFDIALSPSGRHAAVQRVDIQTNNSDIWIIDLHRKVMSRFTFEASVDDDPVWNGDGTYLFFANAGGGTYNIFRKTFTGVGSPEPVTRPGSPQIPCDISRDGKLLLYTIGSYMASQDIWILDISNPDNRKAFIHSEFDEAYPRFSPDGRWIAYCSDESGTAEVYVQSHAASGGRWQVSTNGGSQPRWRPDGRELFYVAPDLRLMSVEIRAGSTFDFDTPTALFQTRMDNFNAPNRYVVVENGAKFLINVPIGEEFANPVSVSVGLNLGN
jgi:dipeptidyl aminopeptidase/acylaminoacyl peptidase